MFSEKVRVRACGIYMEKGKILLLKHEGIGPNGYLWLPPGGGVEFGEPLEVAVSREFLEETGLVVDTRDLLFVNEHIDNQHHALEFFFDVTFLDGEIILGKDPELEQQMISDIGFFSMKEIRQFPVQSVHSLFGHISELKEVYDLTGYFKFENSEN